jgi:hypothetical protein
MILFKCTSDSESDESVNSRWNEIDVCGVTFMELVQCHTGTSNIMMSIEDGRIFPRELIDHAIGYLHNSPETMEACALTCKEWLPIARIHLFHSINLNNRALGQADRVARRFRELLERKPEFSRLIREISMHWSAPFVCSLMGQVDFTSLTNLEKVSLNFIPWSDVPQDLISTIQILFTLPSLSHLVLYSHVFEGIKQFATLFDECRLNLKTLTLVDTAFIEAEDVEGCMQAFDSINRSRVKLQSLSLLHSSPAFIIPWLLHTHSPIDLSALKSLSYKDWEDVPMLRNLLRAVGSSLKFLEIVSPSSKHDPASRFAC